ncbi:MAG: hypothetical protein K2L12_05305 [Clostridia bacterium]|nr:hypothetical protein [Clostridia bacterium]
MNKYAFYYEKDGKWNLIPQSAVSGCDMNYSAEGASYYCRTKKEKDYISYEMGFDCAYDTKLRFEVQCVGENPFNIIPCNIYGDNNFKSAYPYTFPFLKDTDVTPFASPEWEFRADRAATPLSAVCAGGMVTAITIEPYSDAQDGKHTVTGYIKSSPDEKPHGEYPQTFKVDYVHNGVYAKLGGIAGVSLGYTNYPYTFTHRGVLNPSTYDTAKKAKACGRIYTVNGDRRELHGIIRKEYYLIRGERAEYKNTPVQAVNALIDTFVNLNFDRAEGEYTNRNCKPPRDTEMLPWREVCEIGWTGGSILAYPYYLAQYIDGALDGIDFSHVLDGKQIFDRIVNAYNPAVDMFYNLYKPRIDGDLNTSAWFNKDKENKHFAYTLAEACYYILKTILLLKEHGKDFDPLWLERTQKCLDMVVGLQRGDGAFGFSYWGDRKEVADFDGFAGCWFVPALINLYLVTCDNKYLDSAIKGEDYYAPFVFALNVYGTPMDTRKAVDEEGNLAFITGARMLHEITGADKYKDYLKAAADYEFLWRYSFNSRPDYSPLNNGWRSRGGAVTSISNPHIHPMGLLADSAIRYYYSLTGDEYYKDRADDSTAFIMQCLEMYPEKTGYGRYGVLSERWCPSDGLTIERYSDGREYSSWFSYNLWAAACTLECLETYVIESK